MAGIHTLTDICALFGSVAAAGRAIGVRADTMRKYARLNTLPPAFFDALVRAAQARPGGEAVTHELLCGIAALGARRRAA